MNKVGHCRLVLFAFQHFRDHFLRRKGASQEAFHPKSPFLPCVAHEQCVMGVIQMVSTKPALLRLQFTVLPQVRRETPMTGQGLGNVEIRLSVSSVPLFYVSYKFVSSPPFCACLHFSCHAASISLQAIFPVVSRSVSVLLS